MNYVTQDQINYDLAIRTMEQSNHPNKEKLIALFRAKRSRAKTDKIIKRLEREFGT